MRIVIPVMATLFFLMSTAGFSAEPVDAEELVRQLWRISAANAWAEHEEMISPAFQALQMFGGVDKAQQLKILEKVDFKDKEFELSDFKATRHGNVIVTTYLAGVTETIRGKRETVRHAPRMTIFIKTDTGWKWLAHAVIQVDKHDFEKTGQ